MKLPWKRPTAQNTHCDSAHCDDRHSAWTALRAAHSEIPAEWSQAYFDEAGTRLVVDILHLGTQFGSSSVGLLDNALKTFESETKSGMALMGDWR